MKRRRLFGLLAAAPIAAPLVKEVAAAPLRAPSFTVDRWPDDYINTKSGAPIVVTKGGFQATLFRGETCTLIFDGRTWVVR